ncbi:hypothetical protein GCM10007416_23450 [Kroppenstedtia guangzhouensis]|uniref:2,3-bisphosphoglycerate-dependent phosphoglycerate mutase n=2 Tax=Kroppenstedtia guangzhouensis TaxID=1274356 RepID=A0ABQ1GTK5_9BACL|nr:hypothetical protein GCM10007416_23450 [Kroppenstedtia guangzhouensis]
MSGDGMKIYLIRHGAATGQSPEADLTKEGERRSELLAQFLTPLDLEAVWSSPFRRTARTAAPLVRKRGLPLQTDERLSEWVPGRSAAGGLAGEAAGSLRRSESCLPGGESGHTAMSRGLSALEEIAQTKAARVAVITHGGLLTRLLNHFDARYGFEEWQRLTTPDLFEVEWGASGIRRLGRDGLFGHDHLGA